MDIFPAQPFPNRLEDKMMDGLGIAEADLGLCRVNIDIDQTGFDFQNQNTHGESAHHDQTPKALHKGMI